MNSIIGVDIGGTKIAVTHASERGDIKEKIKFPTEFPYMKAIDAICRTINAFDFSDRRPVAVGISCGGPLDSGSGVICSPPNLPGWDNVPITRLIEERTGIPSFLQNDANGCALAEWTWGAGVGTRNMVFLTFGTGLGAGLILNGELYEGSSGLAGEVGHIRLAPDGPLGYGKRGSWEGFCSGGGLSRYYFDLYGEKMSARGICLHAREGNEKALEVINSSAAYLGRGISVLLDILNPELVVIGSIFARDEDLFRDTMSEVILQEALAQASDACRILPAALGESLGDMSALGIAMNAQKREGS